ncbi:LOW QUALITY PROTEIN: hypothetical protein U9M48_036046, partial [Paspalum notatum var. saurae]
ALGLIPPSPSNLTGLLNLYLSCNSLCDYQHNWSPSSITWMSAIISYLVLCKCSSSQIPVFFSSICDHAPSLAMVIFAIINSAVLFPQSLAISMLTVLKDGLNNLNGTLPHELFRATSLEFLSFPKNNLHGLLDGSNLVKHSNLGFLDLGSNRLS